MGCLLQALFLACGLASAFSTYPRSDLDSFINAERELALNGILANIGSSGSLSQGAKSGVVIASPSTVNPNYLYTWTRDSALTLKTLIDEFIFNGNKELQSHIEDYIHAQAYIQTITNPSGGFFTGAGLGEPKFNIDETAFRGAWGRPQRDGPALRSVALMTYSNWLIANGQHAKAKDIVWPIIINDLNYVGQYWNQTGYDLWEEVHGSSFFTIQNQYRALVQGQQLASALGEQCTSCESQAPQLLCFLQSFWNGTSIVANINTATERSGRDSNNILGPIATFDIDGDCDGPNFQPCNSKVLASHKVLVDSFRGIYPINANKGAGQAVAVGRYPEDVYYGGNPWYLATLAAAEVLYDAIAQWKRQRQLTVDQISLPFFKDIYPNARATTYRKEAYGGEFHQIRRAVHKYADGFVKVVESNLPSNHSLSEQFNRNNSQPLSAYDLTWSFASFVTMAQRRAKQYPASWNSKSACSYPATCSGTSANGTYIPAIAAGAPNITNICTVKCLFEVNATTYFGENILLVGNTTDLGLWNPQSAWPMTANNYTSERPEWYLQIDLVAGEAINYNYLRQESDGSFIEEKVNRTGQVPGCGQPGVLFSDAIMTVSG